MFKLPEKIKSDLPEYGDTLRRFMAGELSPARFAGVRVPWGNYSQRGGKMYMVRIRVPAGLLTPRQLKALAFCAQEFGNGVLHITTRQDIQIHDVATANIIKVHDTLKDYDLSSRGGGGNTVRNITACYLAGVCPDEVFDVSGDATALTEQLIAQDTSFTLPRKFKVAFSGCAKDCAHCLVNDVGLLAIRQNGATGYRIFVGGGMGARSLLGKELEAFVPRDQISAVINAIKNVFHNQGDRKNKHRNRLRFLVEGMGLERFKALCREELDRLPAAKPLPLRDASLHYELEALDTKPPPGDAGFREFLADNVIPQKQKGHVAVRLRIPRGDLGWQQAKALAGLADEFTSMQVRATQDQDLCLVNIRAQDLPRLYERLKSALEHFLYPGTLLDVAACKGSRTCSLGLCNSPGLAEALERMIAADFVGKKVFHKINIRINGCPNACGQHPLGTMAFVGAVRRFEGRPAPHYKLLLGGKAGVPGTRLARDTGLVLPARNIPGFVKEFLDRTEAEIGEQENIHEFLDRRGLALAREIKSKYEQVPPYAEGREFYVDWGGTEEFSMKGLGPGECGAGVIDMIEADLADAAAALQRAEEASDAAEIRKALFYTARALLVVRGSDPKRPEDAFLDFLERFVGTGIASSEYANLNDVHESLHGAPAQATRRDAVAYARGFIQHIQELYGRMDPGFNFPTPEAKKAEAPPPPARTLDLRGVACPLNYVKAKLCLQQLAAGDTVDIWLDAGDPIKNVPVSLANDGHKILDVQETGDPCRVRVERKPDVAPRPPKRDT